MATKKPAETKPSGLRAELAGVLGIDPNKATIVDKMRIDRAVTLRLYVTNTLATQESGGEIDVKELAEASKMLDAMLPPPLLPEPAGTQDLSRLTDDELHTLERLKAKAAGEDIGPVTTFTLEFVGGEPALLTTTDTQTAYLRGRVAELEVRVRELEAQLAGSPSPALLPPSEQPAPKPEMPKTGFVGRIVDNDAAANTRAHQAHCERMLDMSSSAPPGGWPAASWGAHK
jgi:hypothetical protein